MLKRQRCLLEWMINSESYTQSAFNKEGKETQLTDTVI